MKPPENAKVFDWPTSVMWFDEDGILCSTSKKATLQTLEESKKTLEEFKKITGGKKLCMVADITDASPVSKEMRDFAAAEMAGLTKAIAMITRSPLSRMTANLFFRIKPPAYPMKMFGDEKEAKKWVKQYL